MSRGAGHDRLILELRRSTGPAVLFLLLVLAGLFASVTIIRNLAGDKPWVRYATYQVGFDNVEGVVPGRHELRIAGIKAGSIASSRLVGGRPVLTLKIERRYAPLHTDAKVVIRPVTALEDMYVDITSRGSRSAPVLRPGQVLPATRTRSMVEVGRVLDVLDSDTRSRLTSLIDQLGAGTSDRGARIREGLAQIGPFLEVATRLGDALTSRRRNTARLVSNLGDVAQALATRDRQLAGFVDNGGRLLGTLAQHDGSLSATLSRLPGTLQSLDGTLAHVSGTLGPLDSALDALRPVATSLSSGLDGLRRFAREATPAVRSLRPSVRALKPLAKELPRTSQSASDALTPLTGQAAQLAHITDLVKPCLPLIETFTSRVNSLLKWNRAAPHWSPDARADVGVDLGVTADLLPDPFRTITPPCYTDPEAAYRANGPLTLAIPSRDAAASKEQR